MQATLSDSMQESPSTNHSHSDLSIAELDQRLEKAVQQNERSERLICDYLVAVGERRGYEKFGFSDIYYYAEGRFGFSPRKTRYLLHLAQRLQRLPRIKEALAPGRLGALPCRTRARPKDQRAKRCGGSENSRLAHPGSGGRVGERIGGLSPH